MAFKLYSDIRETSISGGTGNQVLSGPLDGSYRSFSSGYFDGDTFFYCMKLGSAREIGRGTFNALSNSISRTQVYKSTNANNLVNFGVGTVDIFVTNIAPDDLDAAGKALLLGTLGALGTTAMTVVGNCYLSLVGSDLQLNRQNGRHLFINGALEVIPAGGVALSATGATLTNGAGGGPLHYIYAYMNSGVMMLERSATAHAMDATTGAETKSGDPTRAFVGVWAASGSGTWSSVATMGASWFNPKLKTAVFGPNNPTTTLTSLAAIPLAIPAAFVNIADRVIKASVAAVISHNVATATQYLDLGLDGATSGGLPSPISFQQSSVGNLTPGYGAFERIVSEGAHTLTPIGYTSTGSLSYSGLVTAVSIFG